MLSEIKAYGGSEVVGTWATKRAARQISLKRDSRSSVLLHIGGTSKIRLNLLIPHNQKMRVIEGLPYWVRVKFQQALLRIGDDADRWIESC